MARLAGWTERSRMQAAVRLATPAGPAMDKTMIRPVRLVLRAGAGRRALAQGV
jgi:hypothetical protein